MLLKKGIVREIGKDVITVDVGLESYGKIPASKFTQEKLANLKVDDEIEVFVYNRFGLSLVLKQDTKEDSMTINEKKENDKPVEETTRKPKIIRKKQDTKDESNHKNEEVSDSNAALFSEKKSHISVDSSDSTKNNPKTGLEAIGYLYNLTYIKEIFKLSGEQVDRDRLNSYVDNKWENNEVLCYEADLKEASADSKDISFCLIELGYNDKYKQPIYGGFAREIPSALKDGRWQGVIIGSKEECLKNFNYDPVKGLVSIFKDRSFTYFNFRNSQDVKNFLNKLKGTAMNEPWGRPPQYPILRSYIDHTYSKLLLEDDKKEDKDKKIKSLPDGRKIFNTGLLDKYFNQIFIIGREDNDGMLSDLGILSETSKEMQTFKKDLPGMASYFIKREDVVFDANLQIKMDPDNYKHIFEDGLERGRLKKYTTDYEKAKEVGEDEVEKLISKIAMEFKTALECTQKLAQRNYKLAIPQFYRTADNMQFLLPIYLSFDFDKDPDCVLAVEYCEEEECYRGYTILTPGMAYNNARLIAKPDVFWLEDWMKKNSDTEKKS
ncbi:DUF3825 domain-containing protein [bacterium]|nr:DUF3825 domain-containing protein [bacterium]